MFNFITRETNRIAAIDVQAHSEKPLVLENNLLCLLLYFV